MNLAFEQPPTRVAHLVGSYLDAAYSMGRLIACLHSCLASDDQDPNFAPEPWSPRLQRSLYRSLRTTLREALRVLRLQCVTLPASHRPSARAIVRSEAALRGVFHRFLRTPITTVRIRCHSDLHLGQMLCAGSDFVVFDFEGEPDRTVTDRQQKQSAVRDVAGMLRSFHYASSVARMGFERDRVLARRDAVRVRIAADLWTTWVSATFLRGYIGELGASPLLPSSPHELEVLVDTFLLDKALYELLYEIHHRPEWVAIPVEGIRRLISAGRGIAWGRTAPNQADAR